MWAWRYKNCELYNGKYPLTPFVYYFFNHKMFFYNEVNMYILSKSIMLSYQVVNWKLLFYSLSFDAEKNLINIFFWNKLIAFMRQPLNSKSVNKNIKQIFSNCLDINFELTIFLKIVLSKFYFHTKQNVNC